jgi:hypothetical protein
MPLRESPRQPGRGEGSTRIGRGWVGNIWAAESPPTKRPLGGLATTDPRRLSPRVNGSRPRRANLISSLSRSLFRACHRRGSTANLKGSLVPRGSLRDAARRTSRAKPPRHLLAGKPCTVAFATPSSRRAARPTVAFCRRHRTGAPSARPYARRPGAPAQLTSGAGNRRAGERDSMARSSAVSSPRRALPLASRGRATALESRPQCRK